MKTTAALLMLGLTILPGCYREAKQKMLTEEFRNEQVAVPLTLLKVVVTDARMGAVESRPLKIHNTNQTSADAMQPPLTAERKALIGGELRRYFSLNAHPVTVKLELVRGQQIFDGNSRRALEKSDVEVKLTFLEAGTGRKLFEGSGVAQPQVESQSGSQAFSDALFDRALGISVYAAMRGISNGLTNGTLSAE